MSIRCWAGHGRGAWMWPTASGRVTVGIDDFAVALAEAPFGGIEHRGFGREGGTRGVIWADRGHGQIGDVPPVASCADGRVRTCECPTGWEQSFIGATRRLLDSIASGREPIHMARERLARKVTVETEVGAPVVVHATSTGKALYCRDSAEELGQVIDLDTLEGFTEHTVTGKAELLSDLAATAERGFALDNEELNPGVRCAASPVIGIRGDVRASIGISGPATRLDEETVGECAVLVRTAAKSLSELLGGEWDFPLPSSAPVAFE